MLQWSALVEQEDSVSSDITSVSDEPERTTNPVHHAFAFNNDYFATGQLEVAPKSCTPVQNSGGSHEVCSFDHFHLFIKFLTCFLVFLYCCRNSRSIYSQGHICNDQRMSFLCTSNE